MVCAGASCAVCGGVAVGCGHMDAGGNASGGALADGDPDGLLAQRQTPADRLQGPHLCRF